MRGRYYIQKQSLNSICENLFHVFSILFIYMKKIVHIHCFFLLIIGGLSSQDSSIRDEIIFDKHNNINGENYHSLALTASGYVVGWGYNYGGQTDVLEGLTNVVAIDGETGHYLSLTASVDVIAPI